jgi:hypothetical protein
MQKVMEPCSKIQRWELRFIVFLMVQAYAENYRQEFWELEWDNERWNNVRLLALHAICSAPFQCLFEVCGNPVCGRPGASTRGSRGYTGFEMVGVGPDPTDYSDNRSAVNVFPALAVSSVD